MKKRIGRIIGFIVSTTGLVFNILEWWSSHFILSVTLSVVLVSLIVYSIYPLLRWSYQMFKYIYKAWRHPNHFLFIDDLRVNLIYILHHRKQVKEVDGVAVLISYQSCLGVRI